jgi:hypothetical protein
MTMARVCLFLLCALTAAPALAQPVMIKFVIGSELATTMTKVTDEHVDTEVGPYYFKDIERLTFQMNLPDSASLEIIKAKGIQVYLRSKRITPYVRKEAPPPPPTPVQKDTLSTPPAKTSPKKASPASATRVVKENYSAESAVGLGLGLDYGGIGMKVTLGATSTLSVFGGIGYNLHKVGYNAGLELNFSPRTKTTGFLSAMYGYNAVLVQSSGSYSQSETFYGPSFGLGIKTRSWVNENFFSIQVILPIRDEEFLNAPMAEKPWPVLISLGYHFGNER